MEERHIQLSSTENVLKNLSSIVIISSYFKPCIKEGSRNLDVNIPHLPDHQSLILKEIQNHVPQYVYLHHTLQQHYLPEMRRVAKILFRPHDMVLPLAITNKTKDVKSNATGK